MLPFGGLADAEVSPAAGQVLCALHIQQPVGIVTEHQGDNGLGEQLALQGLGGTSGVQGHCRTLSLPAGVISYFLRSGPPPVSSPKAVISSSRNIRASVEYTCPKASGFWAPK
jgi:hypothetical protein